MEEKKETFLEELAKGNGIIATACEKAGISRTTYYRWCAADPVFKEKADEVTETQVDFVESKLLQQINEGDTTAIIFYLKTKGKKRGYNEKALPPQERPQELPALPAMLSDADNKKIAAKVESKKAYIVKLLKKQGKYTEELTYQADITARLLVRAEMLGGEMFADGYKAVNVEYSREGNERVTVNPKERLYLDVLEKAQRSLRALGMNTESKEYKSDSGGDVLHDLMTVVKREGDE